MDESTQKVLDDIRKTFRAMYEESGKVSDLLEKVKAGTATISEAQDYSTEVSRLIGKAWQKHIQPVLGDRSATRELARSLLPSIVDENYTLVADYATQVQQAANKRAGIGLKAQRPQKNTDRADGLVSMASNTEDCEEVADKLENFSNSVVDDAVRANVEFQAQAGLRPKVVRKAEPGACPWCRALAGSYTYPNIPKDVYRRHDNCHCLVEYDPGNGKLETVHSGQGGARTYIRSASGRYRRIAESNASALTTDASPDKIDTRKQLGATKQRKFQSEEVL